MDVYEAIQKRRSIRKYKDVSVNDDDLKRIIECGTLAPNGFNLQRWFFVVLKNKSLIHEIGELLVREGEARSEPGTMTYKAWEKIYGFSRNAPVLIAVIGDLKEHAMLEKYITESKERYFPELKGLLLSFGAAVENMCLEALALGYGTCCIMPFFAYEKIERLLPCQFSGRRQLICLIALGVPDEDPVRPSRKPLEEVYTIVP